MISNRRLKIAISGLGRIAWDYHIPTILRHPQFELTAVADPLEERRQEAVRRFGVQAVYADVAAMLAADKPDLLVIASPTCFHMEQTMAAFKAGIDVICEKPLAGKAAEALRMVDAMKHYRRRLMVYQPHRLTGEAVALKQILASGMLGRVVMVRRTNNNFSRRDDWQAFAAYGGGMLNNYGSHYLDQFIYLFGGNMKTINAVTRCLVSCGDAEDFVKLLAVNGRDVTFDLEINMASAFESESWEVYGLCGSARLEKHRWLVRYFQPGKLKPLSAQTGFAAAGRSYPYEADIPWQEQFFPCSNVGLPGFYDYCYRYFALDEAPLIPVENSMEVMRLLEQCRPPARAEDPAVPEGCPAK